MFQRRHEASPTLRRRLKICGTIALLSLSTLYFRLWTLQVLRGEEMQAMSESNRIRLRRVEATRGRVVDRYGRVLIDSQASFDAVIVPEDARDLAGTVETVAQFLRQSSAETQTILSQAAGRPRFQELLLKRGLTREEVVSLETHQLELPGVSLRISPRRSYTQGTVLAHVLGYVGEINPGELTQDTHYRQGDLIGKSGIEKTWEENLRGVNGGQQVEVDAVGRELRVLQEVQAVPGSTLVLTINLDLQKAAEEALAERAGSVVALDPRNGEVLAVVSHPSFDPNLFARGIQPAEWRELIEHPRKPLNDRAVQGQFPPGSTFKVIVATAALEEGIITPFTRLGCSGGIQFGNHFFRCWKKEGHGSMNVHEALVNSCDSFFYQVGQRVGIETIAEYARAFGLGTLTGVGLEHEKMGIVPDAAWKKKRFGQPWYAGETLSVSIGQGYVTATPLQMAQMIATASTGIRYRPHLVQRIESPDGRVLQEFAPEEVARLPARKTVLAQVREALADVVARGTGKNAKLPDIAVAGKTGTSQVVKLGVKRVKAVELPWQERDHAWFVAYAPAEDPTIAIAAMVEHADGGGGAIAAPLVRQVLESFFRLKEEQEPAHYAQN